MPTACTKSTKRLQIEIFHQSIKQNTSLSKSPTRIIRTQSNPKFASLITYCKLELLKVKTSLNHFAIKQKLLLKANILMFNELQVLKGVAKDELLRNFISYLSIYIIAKIFNVFNIICVGFFVTISCHYSLLGLSKN